MATFANCILNEPDFIKKIDIVNLLKKKQNIYFNTSVILKAELAREFIDTMKLDVDRNLVLTACLMYNCLKIDSKDELERLKKSKKEYETFLLSLGFDEKFCRICEQHSRIGNDKNVIREKESDILEIVDQYGGLIMHRSDRLAYTVSDALDILVNRNMKDKENQYLDTFIKFVNIMEEIKV